MEQWKVESQNMNMLPFFMLQKLGMPIATNIWLGSL